MAVTPAPLDRTSVILAGHSGDVVTARAALTSSDCAVRAAAFSALARIGVLQPAELVLGINDESRVVAARAAELSAKEPADSSVDDSLLHLLNSADTDLCEVAAWALGERHQQTEEQTEEQAEEQTEGRGPRSDTESAAPIHVVMALVHAATEHPDALVRESAVAALGCIGDPASLPAILRGCNDKATVRRRAVIALASFEGPEVDAALERARSDRDWQVRQAGEDLLA